LQNIKQKMRNENFFTAFLISLSIIVLGLGGVGGSFQPSRLIIILLLPWILMKLFNIFNFSIFDYRCQIVLFCIITFFLGLLSISWSIDRLTSLGSMVVILINMMPLIAVALMSNDNLLALKRFLPIAWTISASLTLPLAAYEIYTGNHFLLEHHERGGGVGFYLPFAAGLTGNLNNYSLYLVFCLFGMLFFNWHGEILKRVKYFMIIIGVLIVSVVVINSGRATILTLFGLLFFQFKLKIIRIELILLTTISLIVVKLLDSDELIDLSILSEYLTLKFTDFSNDLESEQGRIAILFSGISGVTSSFGLGTGVGASTIYLDVIERVYIPNTHNLLLEWTLSFGVLGLISFIYFLIITILAVKNNIESSHRKLIYTFVLLTPLYGLAQSNLIGYTYFWLALATMAAYSRFDIAE